MTKVIRSGDARVTVTPNARMTTLASPTLSGTRGISLWRVAMQAGQEGPLHSFDAEQAWTVLSGSPTVTVGETAHELAPGDTITIPAGELRRIRAGSDAELLVCGPSSALATPVADGVPGEPVGPAWVG